MSDPLYDRGIVIPHFLEPIDSVDCESPTVDSKDTHDIDPIIIVHTFRETDADAALARELLKINNSPRYGSFQSMSRRADGKDKIVSDPTRTGGFGFSEFEVKIRDTLSLSLRNIALLKPEDENKAYLSIKGAGGWKQKTGKQKRKW